MPRTHSLATLSWRGADASLLGRIVRHAPALRVIDARDLPNESEDLDAALLERCLDCVSGAGASAESVSVDGVGALRLLSSVSLGPALTELAVVNRFGGDGGGGPRVEELLARADAPVLLAALPHSVRTLALYDASVPATPQLLAALDALPGVTRLVVRVPGFRGDAEEPRSWQVTALQAALAAGRSIAVSFVPLRPRLGPEVRTELALPPEARQPWVARLEGGGGGGA